MRFSAMVISLAVFGMTAAFPTMAPFNMNNWAGMQQLNQLQKQGQSQGSGAATGDAAADFGTLQSQQTSNIFTNKKGTNAQSGSLGACAGGNCGINGASQITAQGQSQKQGQLSNQNLFGQQGQLNPGLLGSQFGVNNVSQQKQKQSQSQIGGAAVGSGNVGLGNVSSVQNTVGQTDEKGGQVGSSNIGQGLGSQVKLNGAVQASGQNQNAKQQANNADQSLNVGTNQGPLAAGSNSLQHANQSQSQSQGSGASVGEGSAGEGQVDSAQSSNVNTNDKGTMVASNSAGKAAGKGIRLSGATSSQGQQANQKQQSLNLQGFNMSQ